VGTSSLLPRGHLRRDFRNGLFWTEFGCPHHVRFTPGRDSRVNIPVRQLRARSGHSIWGSQPRWTAVRLRPQAFFRKLSELIEVVSVYQLYLVDAGEAVVWTLGKDGLLNSFMIGPRLWCCRLAFEIIGTGDRRYVRLGLGGARVSIEVCSRDCFMLYFRLTGLAIGKELTPIPDATRTTPWSPRAASRSISARVARSSNCPCCRS
jgi:hypothetical protein